MAGPADRIAPTVRVTQSGLIEVPGYVSGIIGLQFSPEFVRQEKAIGFSR